LHFTRIICLAAAAFGISASGMTASATAGSLLGAGSTLVYPMEQLWATGFSSTGNTVTYDPVGSSTGITDVSAGLVDFGASDAPMTPAQAAGCDGGHCVTIPWALTATGLGYNVPGIGEGLKLNSTVLAAIYLGTIKTWNDPKIRRLNKGVHLPNLAITPVFRSDGSGDTYGFTKWLSNLSPAWSRRVGYGASVRFPTGVGKNGNLGVTTEIGNKRGAIGYVSSSYLIGQHINIARIQNRHGNYEFPAVDNIRNAAAVVHTVPTGGLLIVDPPRSQKIAYPLSRFTNVIVPHAPAQAALVKRWLTYCLTTGRSAGLSIDFAPIPAAVQRASLALVNSLQ
jgi:phosphate transport system substrate-binding protein